MTKEKKWTIIKNTITFFSATEENLNSILRFIEHMGIVINKTSVKTKKQEVVDFRVVELPIGAPACCKICKWLINNECWWEDEYQPDFNIINAEDECYEPRETVQSKCEGSCAHCKD